MLGEQIGELRGKRTARRVVSVESGFKVEVTFEDRGKMLGVEGGNIGTYQSMPRPDGTLCGEGQGVFLTSDGETVTWKGIGTGRFTGGGAVSYRGALSYSTMSKKFARLRRRKYINFTTVSEIASVELYSSIPHEMYEAGC